MSREKNLWEIKHNDFSLIIKGVEMFDARIQAIKEFFENIELLKELKIVRSDVLFGDIGEFLCTVVYDGLILEEQKTNTGFDAKLGTKKVQIKFSDSSDAKNIKLGNPNEYEMLIVVLGKNSAHRMTGDSNDDYIFYRFSKEEVINKFKIKSGYTLSKTKHFKKAEKNFTISTFVKPFD